MENLTINTNVVLHAGKNEYKKGVIKKIKGNKALVFFTHSEFSRWCNISNLLELVLCA
jgi:hypothetical protein